MTRDVPICERGFLTSIKKSPKMPIHELTKSAKAVCAGLEPDYNGAKFKSPYHQITDIDASSNVNLNPNLTGGSVRPMLPTYGKLKEELKDSFKKYIVIKGVIIGMCDKDNRLHLMRPKKMNKEKK
jgi:hypothetical protein